MAPRTLNTLRVSMMLLVAASWTSKVFAQSGTTFSGDATVVTGTVAGVPVNLAGTGPIEPGGGARNNSLVCYPDGPQCQIGIEDQTGGAVTVQLLNASTVGRGKQSQSNASVAELTLNIGGVPIESGFIQSSAQTVCSAGLAAISGGSELVDLVIAGAPVDVSGLPNQTITVPSPLGGNVTIVLNEQTGPGGAPVQNGNRGDITVSALHVTAPAILGVPGSDLIVAQAHADISCGQPACNFADKVTSGGFVMLAGGGKGNFAAAGRNASDWGHFQFINHATRDKLKATQLTTTFTPDGVAIISGLAEINGAGSFAFEARLKDNGEPGRDDLFGLTSGHPAFNVGDQRIAGGNIQFHRPRSCETAP